MPTDPDKKREAVEALVAWAAAVGYAGELSAITAAFTDIPESMAALRDEILPCLRVLRPDQCDRALSVIIEAISHFNHVRDHADDALESLNQIREYIEPDVEC
jgi:hypothetical protein